VFTNPQAFQQAMQVPALSKSFNDILEFSGLNQSDFMSLTTAQLPQQMQLQSQPDMTQPMQMKQGAPAAA
jgi:hypothetical protein